MISSFNLEINPIFKDKLIQIFDRMEKEKYLILLNHPWHNMKDNGKRDCFMAKGNFYGKMEADIKDHTRMVKSKGKENSLTRAENIMKAFG